MGLAGTATIDRNACQSSQSVGLLANRARTTLVLGYQPATPQALARLSAAHRDRGVDFEPRRCGIRRPMTMANPNTGARTVDMAFYSVLFNDQDSYLVALEGEKLPEGFQLHYHEGHWRK